MATAPSLAKTLQSCPKDLGALEKACAASSAGPLLDEAKATLKRWREDRAAQASRVAEAVQARDVIGLTAALQAFDFVETAPQHRARESLAQWTPQYENLRAETKRMLALKDLGGLKAVLDQLQSLGWAEDDWVVKARMQLSAVLPTYESQLHALVVAFQVKHVAGLQAALEAWSFRRTEVRDFADALQKWKPHQAALTAQAKRMTRERDVRGLSDLRDLWDYGDVPPEIFEAKKCFEYEAPRYNEACEAIHRHVDAHDLRRLNAVLQGWVWPEEPLVKSAREHQQRWQNQMDKQLSDIRHCIDAKDPAGLEAALGRWEFPVEGSLDHFEVLRARRVLSAWLGGYHATSDGWGHSDAPGADRLTEDDFSRCQGENEVPAYFEKAQSTETLALETMALASSLVHVGCADEKGVAVAAS
jgi:hypothetical protein